MGKRNAIRAVIFLTICLGVFVYLNQAFNIADLDGNSKTMNSFYAEKSNSWDGVYIGSSAANRFWNGTLAYNQYGYSIFTLATTSQPMIMYKPLIEEVKKTQDPDLYIMELRDVTKSADNLLEPGVRRVTDNMKYSLNWIRAIDSAIDFAEKGNNDAGTNKIDYYLRLLKYHGRWNSDDRLTTEDLMLRKTKEETKGYLLNVDSYRQEAQSSAVYSPKPIALDKNIQTVLEDLLSYCDTLDAEVLFVLSPYCGQDLIKSGRMKAATQFVEERGYTVLNFNDSNKSVEAMGLDIQTDYYDMQHVNILGAEKYTTYLAKYLSEHYELKDHRGDKDYQSWDDAYKYYVEHTAEERKAMKQSTKEPQ